MSESETHALLDRAYLQASCTADHVYNDRVNEAFEQYRKSVQGEAAYS